MNNEMIYNLNEEEKETILYHIKTFDKLNEYGLQIFDAISEEEKIPDYMLSILSLLYKTLEINDSLKVMVSQSLINAAFPILRVQLETAIQLLYMISDNSKSERRGLIYQIFDIGRNVDDIMKGDYENHMKNHMLYGQYFQEICKSTSFNNWYSYCEGKKINLKGLSKIAGVEELYNELYRPLSIESHGIATMESNIDINDGKFYFKKFRNFERNHTVAILDLKIMLKVYEIIIGNYKLISVDKEFTQFKLKAEEYIKSYYNIKEWTDIIYKKYQI